MNDLHILTLVVITDETTELFSLESEDSVLSMPLIKKENQKYYIKYFILSLRFGGFVLSCFVYFVNWFELLSI